MSGTASRVPSQIAATELDPAAALIWFGGARERFVAVLECQGFRCEAFEDAAALLNRDRARQPSMIVVWLEDPCSELERVQSLSQRLADVPLAVICLSIERWEVRATLAAGAMGVVLAESVESALGPCLHAMLAGQVCVPREHWRQVEPPVLSSREKQILGLVVMGYTNGQIAQSLFLAESTVKSHLSSAFGKLGVRSRNAAVDLILDPERGYGMGILGLGLGGNPIEGPELATASGRADRRGPGSERTTNGSSSHLVGPQLGK